jgi:hypothetical protein
MIARVGVFYGRRPRGPKWYVDAVAGDDANGGTAPGRALRTIAAVLPRIAAGDVVGLARGSRWREQLIMPADGVRVVAYGAGSQPLLDCSDPIAAGAWSKTEGWTNVYQASVTHDIAINKTFIGCWEDTARLQWKTSLAEVDATPGSYTLSDTSGAPPSPATLYVHAAGSTNPAANGRLYEYSSRCYALYASGRTGCAMRGIHTRRNLHSDGSLILGNFNTAVDCLATDGQYHSVFVSPGCHLVNVIANEAYHPTAIGMFVWDPIGNGEDICFEGCQALLPAYVPGMGGGFGGHGVGTLGTITFRNCLVQNCEEAFEGTLASRLIVQDCRIAGPASSGVAAYTPSQVIIENLTADSISARLITAISDGATVSVTGVNAASPNGATAVFLNGLNNVALTMTDCDLTGFSVVSHDGGSGLQFTFLRNQILSGPWNIFWLNPAPAAINSDNNVVYAGAHVQWGSANYSWADYKQTTGQDAHSTP